MTTHRIDVSAERCPMTWVRTKLALESIESGALLEVLLGSGEMLANVPRNVTDDGHEVVSLAPAADGLHRLLVRKGREEGGP